MCAKRPKYKELWKGPHRLRQYVGSNVVKVTLRDLGTYTVLGSLSADSAFSLCAAAWLEHADRLERESEATPPTFRDCPTLAEVNARRPTP
jgi:predicted outer membrane lipoprotein